jgi:hypothetical protein
MEDGLRAVGRAFVDIEIGEDEAWAGKHTELDGREARGTTKGSGYELGDVALIAADADVGRNDDE